MLKEEIQKLMDEESEKFALQVKIHNERMHILEAEKEKFVEDRLDLETVTAAMDAKEAGVIKPVEVLKAEAEVINE